MLSLTLAAPALTTIADASDHWAVLVAGSSGYSNYRHQADVCHAYQLFKRAGLPESQIITLAVDDIAKNSDNPFPGKLFNKPTADGVPGVDVYAGCKIDYSGKMVTPTTFTKVLTGDVSGLNGGKVLKSTASSRVFVNFVDHGGVDIIGFPRTTMHSKDLVGALQQMNTNKMYKELVFYLEACESGSMFLKLPDNIHIYATTAANAKESSWGTYCMPQDKVDGKHINSCLGDLYSVNWMEDADLANSGETLGAQYTRIKQTTTKSHVIQFGDTSITSELTTAFGEPSSAGPTPGPSPPTPPTPPPPAPPAQCGSMCTIMPKFIKCSLSSCEGCPECKSEPEGELSAAAIGASSLPSADATLASAFHRFLAGSEEAAAELTRGVQQRQAATRRFNQISTKVAGVAATALAHHDGDFDHECHYSAYRAYIGACGEWDPEAMAHSATLAKLCKHTHGEPAQIVSEIEAACAKPTVENAALIAAS